MISEFSLFRYVEIIERISEVPFQCLDFQDVSSASVNQIQSEVVMLSSIKSANETLEKGPFSSWG